ncbi:uncharacterized protein SPAPADRAFT_132827 [Spathaspora passalidarum NRRL Y-27907]|uniref:Autophagy protein 5 n=1 Tax=Spathaspora passalidarum (strain NRRL Y-27907 / 11-Y1) TaxID=619300 RepID=G3AF49_SPAPN|nr:uncharacterized protein SPAPADRAFT_132827 [Spathaspora passalidarum NRRL Y-27907]EGW34838.1 hypothetical protein SPAPADRAFT_132827 [Spathaspora passalidarum NRRL Y-27907]
MNFTGASSSATTEIKRKLWNGCINIKVVLPHDSEDIEYLINIPRNSYLPIHFQQLISYFQNYVSYEIYKQALWFEYEGVPIAWNLPVGVLYDYLYLPSVIQERGGGGLDQNCWTIQLNLRGKYPAEYIIPFVYTNPDNTINYEQSLNEIIVNQLKQSCFVINGSAKPIMNLSESNSKLLWNSIVTRNLGQFTSLNKKIIPKQFQRIPVKIYIPGSTTVIQAPIHAYEDDKPVTLSRVLQRELPNLFTNDVKLARTYIHGIDISSIMDMPLHDIWTIFRHLDNFLYIIIIAMS